MNNSTVGLNDFEILKVIGKGSFGKVFQVKKMGENEIYAMKVLNKSVIKKKNQIEHTKTERNILGRWKRRKIWDIGLNQLPIRI